MKRHGGKQVQPIFSVLVRLAGSPAPLNLALGCLPVNAPCRAPPDMDDRVTAVDGAKTFQVYTVTYSELLKMQERETRTLSDTATKDTSYPSVDL